MNCGIKCSPYCRPANRTRWGVIVPEWMIAKRWMRFSIVYEQDVNGKRSRPQGSVQAAAPIGVFRNGPEQVTQTVAERAPDGFIRIEDVLSAEELEDAAAGYKHIAGFDKDVLNNRAPIVS